MSEIQIEMFEITAEEREMIIRTRVESARKAEIEECGEVIRRALRRITELNGSVELPTIGGRYVSLHNPRVKADNITVRYW